MGPGDTPANGLQRRCRALLLRGLRGVVLKDAQDGRVTAAQLARNHARGCAVGVLGEHLGDLDAVDARCAVVQQTLGGLKVGVDRRLRPSRTCCTTDARAKKTFQLTVRVANLSGLQPRHEGKYHEHHQDSTLTRPGITRSSSRCSNHRSTARQSRPIPPNCESHPWGFLGLTQRRVISI